MKNPKYNLKARMGYTRAQLLAFLAAIDCLLAWAEIDRGPGQHAFEYRGVMWELEGDWGICHNLYYITSDLRLDVLNDAFCMVPLLAMEWPGSIAPGDRRCWPVVKHVSYGFWEGPNRAGRISLLRYMRKRLRDWLRRTPA